MAYVALMRLLTLLITGSAIGASSFAAYPESLPENIDVSNQIILPGCEIDVSLRAIRWEASTPDAQVRMLPRDFVADARISLNGAQIKLPNEFLDLIGGAARILDPTPSTPCGFIVQLGDASSGSRLLVRIGNSRIESLERLDFQGRVLSRTTIFSLKPIVLD